MTLPLSRTILHFRHVLLVLSVAMPMLSTCSSQDSKCEFKAIFNFGDSNSDTGGFWAAFPAQSGPFGITFFKKPTGRATDGRVILDFLGSDYRHGANFATLASTVLLPNTSLFVTGISPFSLAIQLNQMKEFKAKVVEYHSTNQKGLTKLPSPAIFGKSLYTFYIGQNDFTSNLKANGIEGVKQYLPQVVSQIAGTIKELYGLGGRTFFVLNLAPVGCYPALLVQLPHDTSDLDEFGCLISYNNAVVDYNSMLKEALSRTRRDLPDASLIHVDTHAVLLQLFQDPTSHGLRYGTRACCGYGGGKYNFHPEVYCGNSKVMNGSKVTAMACKDPNNYVSWDGIHATEAANKLTTLAILNGSYFDPPFPLHSLCYLHPIG
ncbi:GDSL esterase/lipase At4g01130-like isoform X2 [Hibiscus syriacus]|uniref:GDSL esterase/lipase At4g01130-like isoform X2 n=1 Tax=Hibiscus syriacus TaxID=106335 RepID=UPI001922D28A|nr:GDSL esterase/lipase At4g01130-like isoform X2 [Hibiscus syriacus]